MEQLEVGKGGGLRPGWLRPLRRLLSQEDSPQFDTFMSLFSDVPKPEHSQEPVDPIPYSRGSDPIQGSRKMAPSSHIKRVLDPVSRSLQEPQTLISSSTIHQEFPFTSIRDTNIPDSVFQDPPHTFLERQAALLPASWGPTDTHQETTKEPGTFPEATFLKGHRWLDRSETKENKADAFGSCIGIRSN